MGQPANQDQQLGLDESQLPIKVRTAEVNLSPAGASVSSAATFTGKALGDGGQVDLPPRLPLRGKTRSYQPSHQHRPRPSLEGQPADGLDRAGRLADEHDAVVRMAAQDRGRLWQVTRLDASGAGEDLAVKSGKAHGDNLTIRLARRQRDPRLNRCEEGASSFRRCLRNVRLRERDAGVRDDRQDL